MKKSLKLGLAALFAFSGIAGIADADILINTGATHPTINNTCSWSNWALYDSQEAAEETERIETPLSSAPIAKVLLPFFPPTNSNKKAVSEGGK
jgi:hypothetical protein